MSPYALVAWAGTRHVGTLSYHDDTGLFAFDYAPEWVISPDAFPLSPALPFQSTEVLTPELHSVRVRRFFENLLPEGKALDDAAAAHGVSKANLYALLTVIGRESAGALTLLPAGMQPAEVPELRREITYDELSERIRDRANRPFNVWDGRVRMSIAGYQDKVASYIDGPHFYLVEGRLASTHILKPEPFNPRLANLVANEHFCLCLAGALGIEAAPVDIVRVPEPVLVVERFDRRRCDDHVERLHVIDACQALNMGVSHKYERNFGSGRDVAQIRDGVSLERLFSLCGLTVSEAATRLALVRWTLLQFLIGNSDAHGKNVSFFVLPGGLLRLAPTYDLVAVVSTYADVDHELAMAIGDTFDLADIRAYDWADFAQRCGVERRLLVREMRRLTKDVRKAVPELLAWEGYHTDERAVLAHIGEYLLGQAARLDEAAAEVVRVTLD